MKPCWLPLLILATLVAASPAPPQQITAAQRSQLGCVAALAIVANGQQNGSSEGEGEGVPRLARRGPVFAARIGEAVMTASRQPREAVRDAILAEVSQLQKRASASDDPAAVARDAALACLPMLDRFVPPAPPPSLPVCAAAVGLAADDVRAREGLSNGAKDLITFATVIDNRAREALRNDGQSAPQTDATMSAARAAILAQTKRGDTSDVDLETCFEFAKPDR